MTNNFYKTLGIQESASPDEIKKAYRKLALKYHPDKNLDKSNGKKFKAITEAYNTLSDPAQKTKYDERNARPDIDDFFSGFGDIFRGMGFDPFAEAKQRRQETRQEINNGDVLAQVSIDLEDVVYGTDKNVKIVRHTYCKTCKGMGYPENSPPHECDTCAGHGRVRVNKGFVTIAQTCPQCSGLGVVIVKPCVPCMGNGHERIVDVITVKIPKGVYQGTRLKVAGMGDKVNPRRSPGDAYIHVGLKTHKQFERDGLNLYSEMPIPYSLATLGGETFVKTLWGMETIKVPKGTQCNDVLTVKGKGLPSQKNGRGDLCINVLIHVPKNLDDNAITAIQNLIDHGS